MSQPPAESTGNPVPTRYDETPQPLTFTLVVLSPSVGATKLSFTGLPATTTVKQLKARLRDALPSKPPDDSQRLIHRGRMLARETETMLDIFGQDTLNSPEPQTLHLVLRPAEGTPAPPSTSIPRPQVVAPQAIPQPLPVNPSLSQQLPRPQSTPTIPAVGLHAQQPLPGFQHVQQHQMLHHAEQHHNIITQRLQQLQRETQRLQQEMGAIEQRYRTQGPVPGLPIGAQLPPQLPGQQVLPQGMFQLPHLAMRPPHGLPTPYQNFIAHQQRGRAAEGRNGVQDSGNITPNGSVRGTSSGRVSPNLHRPDHTTTYTREGVGPNGERWQMTVNETTTTLPIGQPQPQHPTPFSAANPLAPPNPALDIQAVLRNADRYLAAQNTRNALNNMQRSASNPNASPRQANMMANNSSTTPTAAATPTTTTEGSPSTSTILNPTQNTVSTTTTINNDNSESMVYILSSPQGPRGLLVSNSASYYTPRQHSRRHQLTFPTQSQGAVGGAIGLPEYRNRQPTVRERAPRRENHQQNGVQEAQAVAPHANPGAGALAAQAGPMLWLIIRLVGFVWFLTSGNPSWYRWFMVSGLAFAIFIYNTGLFNGAADQVWGPIRRHLEALIPLAGPDAAMVPAANAAVPPPAAQGAEQQPRARARTEPDPAETAARLLEQHRQANGGWLLAQVRRVEHALLLFLASLVPGVGERHIAAREAEAAERQRRIDAAAAEEQNEGITEQEGALADEVNADISTQRGQENQTENEAGNVEAAAPLVEV